jgi:glutamyl-tRNA reductase
MGQLKQAWRQSIQLKAQGSLLERAMQAVFRTHKRVVNETDFHKGTQSTAYKALKFVSEEFGRVELKNKKMLLIGAGEIILNLIKYLPKFNFMEVAIANRTAEKANKIARQNKLSTYEWEKVEANDFEDFDIIISAVSNRSKLVQHTGRLQGKKVLIDMAVPANIDPKLATSPNIRLFGLDDLTASLSDKKTEKQISIAQVQKLIREETNDFSVWLKKKAVREFLTKCQQTQKTRSRYSPSYPDLPQGLSPKDFELLVNRINEQVVKETAGVAQHAKPDELSVQNMSCIIEVFTNQQNQHEENRSFNC